MAWLWLGQRTGLRLSGREFSLVIVGCSESKASSLLYKLPGLSGHAVHWAASIYPVNFARRTLSYGEPWAVAAAGLPRPVSACYALFPLLTVPVTEASSEFFQGLVGMQSTGPSPQKIPFTSEKTLLPSDPSSLPRPLSQLGSPAPSTSGPTSRKDTPAFTAEQPDVQALMDEWKDVFLAKMKDMFGTTLLQPTVGPSVLRNTGPSDDRETSWAQHKAGSKRTDGCSRIRALQVVRQGKVEMEGLSRGSTEIPVPRRLPYANSHLCLNG